MVTISQVCHLDTIYSNKWLRTFPNNYFNGTFSWHSNLNLLSNQKLCVFALLPHPVKKTKQNKNNSVLDIGGFLKEFNIVKLYTQDKSTSQFIINLLLNLSVLKQWFKIYPSCSEWDYVNRDRLTPNVFFTIRWPLVLTQSSLPQPFNFTLFHNFWR